MGKVIGTKKGSILTMGSGSKVSMKYRPSQEVSRSTAKGTKPLAEAASVKHILGMMVVHLSRKILYGIDVSHRVAAYIVGVLILSVIGDFSNESTNFFANKDNFFNVYFVKYGFGWTILTLGPFVFITSFTAGCGRPTAIKSSIVRVIVNCGLWIAITSVFYKIEELSGMCSTSKYRAMNACKAGGHNWRGLDISGHCYLLISCNLTILEELKSYLGWERIKDMLRNEEHKRLQTELPSADADVNESCTALSKLTLEEFIHLKSNYKRYTVFVRALFCLVSILVILWDLMLFCTAIYFHIMIEKVVASCVAVILWFFLYRVVFPHLQCLPGQSGPFKYVTFKPKNQPLKRTNSLCRQHREQQEKKDDGTPKFMGMPLYGLEKKPKISNELPAELETSKRRDSADYGKLRARSRSSSRIRLSGKSSLNNLKYL